MIVPVLMYHSVDERSTDYLTIARDRFRRHIEHLLRRYTVVPLRDVFGGDRLTLPRDAVVVSFDDSMKDNVEHAAPILDELGAPALFFVIAGTLGRDNSWDHRAYRTAAHMSRVDLRALVAAGHDVGSHSLTHQRLPKLAADPLEREFVESRRIIEAATGTAPLAFAYPYGDADQRCARLCLAHYRAGFTTVRQGCFDWRREPARIRRIYVAPTDAASDLDRKITCYRGGRQHA